MTTEEETRCLEILERELLRVIDEAFNALHKRIDKLEDAWNRRAGRVRK